MGGKGSGSSKGKPQKKNHPWRTNSKGFKGMPKQLKDYYGYKRETLGDYPGDYYGAR